MKKNIFFILCLGLLFSGQSASCAQHQHKKEKTNVLSLKTLPDDIIRCVVFEYFPIRLLLRFDQTDKELHDFVEHYTKNPLKDSPRHIHIKNRTIEHIIKGHINQNGQTKLDLFKNFLRKSKHPINIDCSYTHIIDITLIGLTTPHG